MNKIIRNIFAFYLFFSFITCVNAQTYALNEKDVKNNEEVIPDISLVIGTYLFTDLTKADTQSIMEATKTIVGDDVVIYQKLLDYSELDDDTSDYPDGMWIDAINGDEMVPANVDGLICITNIDGEEAEDPDCNATRFSVKFENTTAEDGGKTVSVVNGEKIASADVPTPETKRGKKFVCWIEKEKEKEYSNSDSCFKFDETIKKSVTLVPYYEDITYTIKFDINGGTKSSTIQDISCTLEEITTNNDKCKLPKVDETRKGYKFDGWSSVKDESGEEGTHYDAEQQMTDKLGEENEITLYAVWTPILYTITYNLDGGTYEDQTIVKSSYNVLVKEAIDLFTPTKVGYTFAGWEVTDEHADGKPTVKNSDPENKYTLDVQDKTGDITLKAKWKEKEYTITYDLNLEGSPVSSSVSVNNKVYPTLTESLVTPESTTCKFETDCTLATAPQREDYIFAGWAHDDGYLYTGGNKYTGIDFGDDHSQVNLKAQWNAKNEPLYNIKYNLDGGKFPTEAVSQFGRKTTETQLPNPVKTGYTFEGWCSDEQKSTGCKGTSAKIKDFLEGDEPTLKDITLYAKWKANTYTVKFYEPQATAIALMDAGAPGAGFDEMEGQEKECTYDQECDLTSHSDYFEKKKEKLRGWSLSYGEKSNNNSIYLSDGITVKNLTSKENGEVDLYAVSEDIVYSLTYYLDGGEFPSQSDPSKAPTSATKDEEVTIPNPTKEGYTFDGWVDEKGDKVPDTDAGEENGNNVKVTVSKNMILVAKWKKDYQIEIYLDGGKFNSDQSSLTSTKYKDGTEVDIPNPIKDGYNFAGWVDKDGKAIKTEKITPDDKTKVKIKVTNDMLLVATWVQKNPEIKVTRDGNPSTSNGQTTARYNVKLTANNKKGFKALVKVTITKDSSPASSSDVEIGHGSRLETEGNTYEGLKKETIDNKGVTYLDPNGFKLVDMEEALTITFKNSGNYKVTFDLIDFNYPDDVFASTYVLFSGASVTVPIQPASS